MSRKVVGQPKIMVLTGDFLLRGESVHVWIMPQTISENLILQSQTILPLDERLRANKFISERARDQFLYRRIMLRQLLGLYSYQAPQLIVFDYGDYGKPKMSQSSLFFNTSHSEDTAIVAISTLEIGVDVEAVRALSDLDLVAKHHFSELEQQILFSLQGSERVTAFYRCWTRKEAFIKLIGTGLYTPLDSFAVTLLEHKQPQIEFLTLQPYPDCSLYSLEIGAQYIGALATYKPINELIIHDLR